MSDLYNIVYISFQVLLSFYSYSVSHLQWIVKQCFDIIKTEKKDDTYMAGQLPKQMAATDRK